MKCHICKDKAVIKLRQHSLALCARHFDEWMLRRVQKAISDFKMFSKKDKIILAVSGGKDSLALWDILTRLGYYTSGLYINLGITHDGYSDESEELCWVFVRNRKCDLIVVDITQAHGMTVMQKARAKHRSICSACGLTKRYYMNQVAITKGFDVIATGHNLDDQAAALLGNILHWNVLYLANGSPYSPPIGEGHPAKTKPLFLCTEKETTTYCLLRNISFVEKECPYAEDATFLEWKRLLNRAEERSPGTKWAFYRGYLKNMHLFAGECAEKEPPYKCKICGLPSWHDTCSFCRFWKVDNTSKQNQ